MNSEINEFLEERKRIALEFVELRKEQVFSELIDSGLTEDEIYEIIENWRHLFTKNRVVKKEGLLVLQGIAACLHTYQNLVYASNQKTKKGRIAFNASLADMGNILVLLARAGILAQGKDTRKAGVEVIRGFVSDINDIRNKLSNAEKDTRRKQTLEARKAKFSDHAIVKKNIIEAYKEMKKRDPKISKSDAAQKIYGNNAINGSRSRDTIRDYLRNQ